MRESSPSAEMSGWRGRWHAIPWMGWRLRATVMSTLIGLLVLMIFITHVSSAPVLPEAVALGPRGVEITLSDGQVAQARALLDRQGNPVAIDDSFMGRSARWIVGDTDRQRHTQAHDALGRALKSGSVTWVLENKQTHVSKSAPLGVGNLGFTFWLMSALAFTTYLGTMAVLLARPIVRNAIYAVIAIPQAANMLFIAAQSAWGPYVPEGFALADHMWRSHFDVISAAGMAHAMALHPRPGAWRGVVPYVVWFAASVFCVLLVAKSLTGVWWWTQCLVLIFGAIALIQLRNSRRQDPHPLSTALLRSGLMVFGAGALLTFSLGALWMRQLPLPAGADLAPVIWVVFFASMVMAAPYMARPQVAVREFSLVAGISTLATGLDLIFVAALSLSPFTSLAMATVLALMVYAGARQWILNHVLKTNLVTTEKMFEQLYRIARDTEHQPALRPDRLAQLFSALYDPLDAHWIDKPYSRTQVLGGGATLVVPMPSVTHSAAMAQGLGTRRVLSLRYARKGRRLFTEDDANLTDRVIEQLETAVSGSQAEERGRREERERIAQDLHDDIGARLLTIMYKSKDPEVEDYVRHTIQDLKTLTRGLAAQEHPLADAAAEWKASIHQRLEAAGAECVWRFDADNNPMLTMSQWSAITRILRELITNAIGHGRSSVVQVLIELRQDRLRMQVADNGVGGDPDAWQHGLGLGGIRKRARGLQGTVKWSAREPTGILCEVEGTLRPPVSSQSPDPFL
jgi:signal transduction histidine kinase